MAEFTQFYREKYTNKGIEIRFYRLYDYVQDMMTDFPTVDSYIFDHSGVYIGYESNGVFHENIEPRALTINPATFTEIKLDD